MDRSGRPVTADVRRRRGLHGRPLAWHVLTIPAVPVLALWAGVADQTTTLLPIWIGLWSAAAAVALTLVISIVQRDARRSALVAVLVVVLFGTLGHVVPSGARPLHWLVMAAVIFAVTRATCRAQDVSIRNVTTVLNVVGIALLLANSVVVAANRPPVVEAAVATGAGVGNGPGRAQRDVWYLVPDRYPSSTTLATLGIDNSSFETALRDRGFEVEEDIRSNYPETVLSLASAWSLDLLDTSQPPSHAYRLLLDNPLGQAFRRSGYAYTHLGSWAEATADSSPATRTLTLQGAGEFWTAWEKTTAIPSLPGLGAPGSINQRRHIEHARHQIEVLERLAQQIDSEPTFVLTHLLLPHEPYVFHSDGTVRTDPVVDRVTAYEEQLAYLNTTLLDLIDLLQSRPDEPVILILSDEGPYPADLSDEAAPADGFPQLDEGELDVKYSVFAALRDPDGDVRPIARAHTSINVVRAVVADLLDADLPPVPDHQFEWSDPDRTSIVRMSR